jgi:hypothetical protein
MRVLSWIAVLSLPLLVAAANENKDKSLTPEEAAKKLGQECTVEMLVKSSGKGGGYYFLNSHENFRDKSNFTILISREGVARFKDAKIEDPAAHFKDKTVRATGTVKLFRERTEMVIDYPKQIQIVEKARNK